MPNLARSTTNSMYPASSTFSTLSTTTAVADLLRYAHCKILERNNSSLVSIGFLGRNPKNRLGEFPKTLGLGVVLSFLAHCIGAKLVAIRSLSVFGTSGWTNVVTALCGDSVEISQAATSESRCLSNLQKIGCGKVKELEAGEVLEVVRYDVHSSSSVQTTLHK